MQWREVQSLGKIPPPSGPGLLHNISRGGGCSRWEVTGLLCLKLFIFTWGAPSAIRLSIHPANYTPYNGYR